jgi:hypothetical protein
MMGISFVPRDKGTHAASGEGRSRMLCVVEFLSIFGHRRSLLPGVHIGILGKKRIIDTSQVLVE